MRDVKEDVQVCKQMVTALGLQWKDYDSVQDLLDACADIRKAADEKAQFAEYALELYREKLTLIDAGLI
jgi:hypothetical protein